MKNIIDIDLEMMSKESKNFLDNSNKMNEIKDDIKNAISNIDSIWKGTDSDSFINSCNNLITDFENESIYLNNWSNYISKSVSIYNSKIEDGLSNIKYNNAIYKESK